MTTRMEAMAEHLRLALAYAETLGAGLDTTDQRIALLKHCHAYTEVCMAEATAKAMAEQAPKPKKIKKTAAVK
jgi:hypothetical protein